MKVGSLVVCINDSPGWCTGIKLLEKGKIYEVFEVFYFPNGAIDLVVEYGSGGWDHSRFREVIGPEEAAEVIEEAETIIKEVEYA